MKKVLKMAITVKDVKNGMAQVRRNNMLNQLNAVNLTAYFRARNIPVGGNDAGGIVQE